MPNKKERVEQCTGARPNQTINNNTRTNKAYSFQTTIIACSIASSLLSLRNNTLVLSRLDVIQRPLEMALRALEARIWLILVCLQVRMDELNEAVEVLGRDSFVLLVKVVDVAVENLDEEFDRDSGVHASICDAESTLEAFEDAFAVAVELLNHC